ncbi:serine/threonine-protein kinase [Nocardioides pacificus]
MGEVFAGRYELLDPVAEGGMGSVWLTHDRSDGQVKIAKILRQSDASSLLRFVREQSVRIDHHHVVTPLSWAGMDDRVLFTMPLVRGGSVADLLKEHGPLPVRWVAELLDQTLKGLEAVHAAGIVHRDVKPANLLLEPTGRALPHLRLTDFGIAAPVDEPRMTHASMAIGTPGYMAPEQWHGAHPDPRQDLYAVAAVGLEMLTATRPPGTPGPLVPPDLSSLPEPHEPAQRLVSVLLRSTVEDPDQRHASAAQMRAELRLLELTELTYSGDEVVVRDHFATGFPAMSAVSDAPPGVGFADGATRLDGQTRVDGTALPPTRNAHHPAPATRIPLTQALFGKTRVDAAAAGHPDASARRASAVPGLALVALGVVLLLAALLLGLG